MLIMLNGISSSKIKETSMNEVWLRTEISSLKLAMLNKGATA